ncbi:hypothetical protein BRC87_03600 [Halobacteriales archaeon QS_4_66_20]|nr:MAG: hypothetical protein BRC87_03600 [Halobacteriales archaeon QS_4_66_20]
MDSDDNGDRGRGRMNRRTFLLGSAATLTGSGLLVGARGYSRVESQREVAVDVVGDEDAYLGIVYPESVEFGCETTVEIGLRNQTKIPLDRVDVDARVRGDGVTVDGVDVPDSIELGEEEVVDVTLSCDGAAGSEPTLAFDVSVAGEDTSIETERSRVIELDCECTREKSAWAYGDGSWYITSGQLDDISGLLTLYAGAGRNDLESGLEVGDLYVGIGSDSEGNKELCVNYLVDGSVGDKSIELKSTKFTVVAKPEELLNNNGEAIAPDAWDRKYHDKKGGRCIDVSGMDGFVLAAHATVTITESSG